MFPREISVKIAKELDWYSLMKIRRVRMFCTIFTWRLMGCLDMHVSQCCIESAWRLGKPIPSICRETPPLCTSRAPVRLVLGRGTGAVGVGQEERWCRLEVRGYQVHQESLRIAERYSQFIFCSGGPMAPRWFFGWLRDCIWPRRSNDTGKTFDSAGQPTAHSLYSHWHWLAETIS